MTKTFTFRNLRGFISRCLLDAAVMVDGNVSVQCMMGDVVQG